MSENTPPNTTNENDDVKKPTQYETIKQRLGEKRERLLIALKESDGRDDISSLRKQGRADIPSGSVSHHLAWLQGEDTYGDPLSWWPHENIQLIEIVGRVDKGGGSPTKVIRFTDYGKQFTDYLIENNEAGIRDQLGAHTVLIKQNRKTVGEVKETADSNESRVGALTGSLEDLKDRTAALEDDVEDAKTEVSKDDIESIQRDIDSLQTAIEELRTGIKKNEDRTETILDKVEEMGGVD